MSRLAKVARSARAGARRRARPGALDCRVCERRAHLRVTTSPNEAMEGADVSLLCVGTPSAARGDTDLTSSFTCARGHPTRDDLCRDRPPAACTRWWSEAPSRPARSTRSCAPRLRRRPAASRVGRSARPCAPSSCGRAPVSTTSSPRRSSWSAPTTSRRRRASPSCSRSSARRSTTSTVRTAEALKYACNAFHAIKVDVRQRDGPRLPPLRRRRPRRDGASSARTHGSTSPPTYLRPGFAFGGSCLPEGPASPAASGPHERRRPAAARRHSMSNELVVRAWSTASSPRGGRERACSA